MKPVQLICKGIIAGSAGATVQFQSVDTAKKSTDKKPVLPSQPELIVAMQFKDHKAAKEFDFGQIITLTTK